MPAETSTTPAAGASPQRWRFETADPFEAEAFIDEMYAAQAGGAEFRGSSPVSISQVSAGGLSAVDFTLPKHVVLQLAGTDDLSISHFVDGTVQTERGGAVDRFQAGDVSLGAFPGGDYLDTCRDVRVQIMTIPAAALAEAAGALPGDTLAPLHFPAMAPVSTAAREHWKQVEAFARGVLDDDETASSPLIVGSVSRLLATTALAVFANNRAPEHGLTNGVATSATLARAEEFMRAHAHLDIGLADVAAACHVSPRALQYAFARHRSVTPMQYLRRVRLERAHADLLAADPATGATVTGIAARWGFARASRFTAAYRAAYGTTPRHTLDVDGG